jgi:hypothetical protein
MAEREDIKLVDASAVVQNLAQIAKEFPKVADLLVEGVALQILRMAQQIVPVYEGPPYLVKKKGQPAVAHVGGYLRSTLYVKKIADGVWEVGATAEYAAAQHEHTEYQHTHGEAKYIERPLLRFGLGDMPRHTAEKLIMHLKRRTGK